MQLRVPMFYLLSAAVVLASTAASASGDIAAGKKKAQVCAACHGADGNAVDPQYPRLAGQYKDYLAQALHEYQGGNREHPDMGIHRNDAIMQGMAANLSAQDIDDIAAYFSSLPGKLGDLHGKVQGGD
ncbi:MAG: cytochrome c [Pseudomonadota bacterium]|nr:cytochrome c [Pseudomonadota bacterium]